ncbi:MAG: RHS repeat-associated core domain-containing protein, partial [Reichenbachiella sp.]|uniref:RHS repeat domain-containing protein n=1 Tax=Reichenbachiella sp. TaxID=2184521 RepID=UPI0032649948
MQSFGKFARLGSNLLDVDMATRRGFTDHEHLDEVEIIHMNGRVYDYNLGRFMSVDPFIQAPANSQSLNPYSYIMNNPLAGIDPTGYCSTSDTVSECGDTLDSGETTEITNENGDVVGHAGKDSDGNFHITNSGSNKAQSAVQSSINTSDLNSQTELSKRKEENSGNNSGFFSNLWENINPFSERNVLEKREELEAQFGSSDCSSQECITPELADQFSDVAGLVLAYPPGKVPVVSNSGKLITSRIATSKNAWGEAADGANQGIIHFTKLPNRLASLEGRLGLSPGIFTNGSASGFNEFTRQANRIVSQGRVRSVGSNKKIYFMSGARTPNKGTVVITYKGKLQSMMPATAKNFEKMK